jgi:hypothetical protein
MKLGFCRRIRLDPTTGDLQELTSLLEVHKPINPSPVEVTVNNQSDFDKARQDQLAGHGLFSARGRRHLPGIVWPV